MSEEPRIAGPPTAVPPGSRTAYVVEQIKADLASGALKPGASLRQVEIAKRYGVSPTPVREALRILEADGVVTYTPHRGATVRDISPAMTGDLYRLRAVTEAEATRLAIERMTAAGLAEIERAHEALVQAHQAGAEPIRLSDLNRHLHFTIYRQSSTLFTEYIGILWSHLPAVMTLWADEGNIEQLERDHELIIAAIKAGDAELAGRLMTEHIDHAADMRAREHKLRQADRDQHQAADATRSARKR